MPTELRLAKVYELIDSGKIKLLSLDIFDTLLWRKAPYPIDIFLILGQKLKEEGWLIEAVTPECFADIRILSEQLSRQKKIQGGSFPEITLQEIYWNCSGVFTKISIEEMIEGKKGIFNESDVNDLVAQEVALEKQFTEFDFNILRLIHYAKEKKLPVTLMSDTYLSQEQITTILDRIDPLTSKPFLELIDKMYISCEHGRGKRLGLFYVLLQESNITPQHILHIGDNEKSDCHAAAEANILSVYFSKGEKSLSEIIEKEWPQENKGGRRQQLDPFQGDFGLTALRSKLVHNDALKSMNKDEAFFWKYGATVLGPVMTGFTHWIYKRCKELGQTQVFCLMREGHFYAELIKQCAALYPDIKIDPKPLWVSRQYMMRTCIFHASYEELLTVYQTNRSVPFTVGTFCASIGLKIKEVKKFAKYEHVNIELETFAEELMKYLSSHSIAKEKIIQDSYEKRKRFLTYLSSLVDLTSLPSMTLLDVGWKGTIQGALQMLLYKEGYPIPIHGLYLGTQDNVNFSMLQGFIREGYLLKAGHPQNAVKAIRSGSHVLEQVATAGLEPLVDFDPQGRVITKKIKVPAKQLKQVEKMRSGIFAFCDHLNQYMKAGVIAWDSSSTHLEEQLRQILLRSTSLPSAKEASLLGAWKHDHRSGENISPVLAKDPYYEHYTGDMFPKALLEDPSIVWPAAYAAKYDPYLAEAAQAILQEKLPMECFLSHDSLPLKLFLNTDSFPKKATRSIALKSNANRSFFLYEKLYSVHKPIRELCIEFGGTISTLLRIKSLRLTINRLSKPKSELIIFFEGENNFPNLVISGVEEIEPGVFVVKKLSPTFTYSFEASDVYAVQIQLCCEQFSTV